jgi:electron transport complex protein RnfC
MIAAAKTRRTFPGGIHPSGRKGLSEYNAIQSAPVPKQLAILLNQHIGAVCRPLVTRKDVVKAGQKIGEADAFVSAPVHSPLNGTVKEISLQPHAVLGRVMGIVIEVDADSAAAKQPGGRQFYAEFDENKYPDEQILQAVREAGIVGMGGAGFPTRVKLEPNKNNPIKNMIVNGCECEPFITCDYRVMLEWTEQVMAGIKLVRKVIKPQRLFIGIEDNKPQAIEVMNRAVSKTDGSATADKIEVVSLKTKYPQGGERQLIKSILGRDVPTLGIPPVINALVLNVATAAAIAEAVVFNQPLTHRVVTVTGPGVERPGNFYTPIGMTVGELIDACGGMKKDAVKVILGGPMMGISIADLSCPITKTSGAITVLTAKEIGKAMFERQETACIRCGRCIEACPINLNPTKIAHAVKHDLLELAQDYYLTACIECGCCSYVCPANIELTGYIRTGKMTVARKKRQESK